MEEEAEHMEEEATTPVQTVQQAITAATAARAEKVTCVCVCHVYQ